MKLQHYLSKKGVFSRRNAEKMIRDGYVMVNKIVMVDPLYMVLTDDVIEFDKKINDYANTLGLILFNKPRGVWTNCKQNGKEVVDLLPKEYFHYSSIGRLDKDSEGLILFTNDGVFANRFLNSDKRHERRYLVWTSHSLSIKQCQQLSKGIMLDDGPTLPCKVKGVKGNCYEFVLIEGRNRQIRRMVAFCGVQVLKLKRTHFSDYSLSELSPGEFRWKSLSNDFFNRWAATK